MCLFFWMRGGYAGYLSQLVICGNRALVDRPIQTSRGRPRRWVVVMKWSISQALWPL